MNGKMTKKNEIINKLSELEASVENFNCNSDIIKSVYEQAESEQSSFIVKIISIFGGIFATIAFLFFLGIAGLFDSKEAMIILGLICIVASIIMANKFNKIVLDTLSISLYLIGLAMFIFGMSSLELSTYLLCFITGCIGLTALHFTHNFILAFLSMSVVCGSLIFIIFEDNFNLLPFITIVLLWLMMILFIIEAKILTMHNMMGRSYYAIRTSVMLAFLFCLYLFGVKGYFTDHQIGIWLPSAAIVSSTIFLIGYLIKYHQVKLTRDLPFIYILCLIILLPTIYAPSISGSLLVMLLCFYSNNKTGFVVSVISFLYFIGQYYYDLDFSLLTKSIFLMVSGSICFLLFFYLNKKYNWHESK